MDTIPRTDTNPPPNPPPPKKFESVEDLKKLMNYLETELNTMRAMHKDNMKKLADYFLFMAQAIDGAIWSNDPERMRKVMESTRDNLRSTAVDVMK